jgi:hypothetical protein
MHTLKLSKCFSYFKTKKMKNSELSNGDIAAVEEVAVRCAALLYHRLQQFSDPKKYSKILSKILQSSKDIASALILKYVINNTSDELMTPSEVNAEITTYLQRNGIFDVDDRNSNRATETEPKRYLVPRDLTFVLKKLEKEGIHFNIQGKTHISKYRQKSHPGRPKKSDDSKNENDGRPSVYKITERAKDLQKIMLKPEACDLLRKILVDSGVIYKLEVFMLSALIYSIMDNEDTLGKILAIGSFTKDAPRIKAADINSITQMLKEINDEQIEVLASNSIKTRMNSGRYTEYFLFKLLQV